MQGWVWHHLHGSTRSFPWQCISQTTLQLYYSVKQKEKPDCWSKPLPRLKLKRGGGEERGKRLGEIMTSCNLFLWSSCSRVSTPFQNLNSPVHNYCATQLHSCTRVGKWCAVTSLLSQDTSLAWFPKEMRLMEQHSSVPVVSLSLSCHASPHPVAFDPIDQIIWIWQRGQSWGGN